MDKIRIGDMISVISADASSIITLAGELCELVEPNSNEYFKLHAIFTIAESQLQLLEKMDDLVACAEQE